VNTVEGGLARVQAWRIIPLLPASLLKKKNNCNHHNEVRKNVILYALDLRWSITYHQSCLVNRKTAIVINMSLHVGICGIQEVEDYDVRYPFLVILLNCVHLMPRVLR